MANNANHKLQKLEPDKFTMSIATAISDRYGLIIQKTLLPPQFQSTEENEFHRAKYNKTAGSDELFVDAFEINLQLLAFWSKCNAL